MVAIIDSPDFMFSDEDISSYSKLKKIRLFVKGLFVGFIFKKTEKRIFCFFMNILFPRNGKIFFKDDFYNKKIFGKYKISYPNKRIVRIIKNDLQHFKTIFQSYCLDELEFKDNDLVIDCGANVGELRFAFLEKDILINYIAFEPDPSTFRALEKNIESENLGNTNNLALSSDSEPKEFYIDAEEPILL